MSDSLSPTESRISAISFFSRFDPNRTRVTIGLLAVAGMLEGVGFAAVFPLLQSLTEGPGRSPSKVAQAVFDALHLVGMDGTLGAVLALLSVVFLLKAAVIIYAMSRVATLTADVTLSLRRRLLTAVVGAEWRQVLRYPSGFVTNAIGREAEATGHAFREFCTLLAESLQVLAYLVLVAIVSLETAFVAIVVGAAVMLLLRGRLSAVKGAGASQTHLLRSISARIADALPSLKPLKAMGRESYLAPYLDKEIVEFFNATRRAEISKEVLNRGREPIVVLVLSAGLYLVLTYSPLSPASVVVLALLFYRTVTTLTNVQVRWATVRQGESAFQSLMTHIESFETAKERGADGAVSAAAIRSEVCFADVTFAYDDKPVLANVSFCIPKGSFVAVLGPSGSGKSTLVDLLTRLIAPTSGRVTVDGRDLATITLESWRKAVGYVPQEPMLFSDTVERNITLGDESIPRDSVVRALAQAGALEFVERLSGGVDHRIGEMGTTLSGGQRQRLAIARALARNPQLLILDEPTTALDAQSEAEVLAAIELLKGRLTIVAISHQPAIANLADGVLSVSGGRVRFDSLIASWTRAEA